MPKERDEDAPRSDSRRRFTKTLAAAVVAGASVRAVSAQTPPAATESKAAEKGSVLDTQELAAEVGVAGACPSHCIDGADEIVRRLAPELRAGDVVAVMSNGGFGGIHEKLLEAIKSGQRSAG